MPKTNLLPDLIFRGFNRRRNARKLIVHASNGIVESRFVPIGGMDQWITMRGEDRDHPALLFIHGGPASPYSIFSPLLRSWEKHFTIVHWDQRGAGKTFRKNGRFGSGTITFDRLARDGIEVAQYVCSRLGHEKVILIGSSAGSLIATMMAKRCPHLFHAYVGTDQNASDPQFDSYRLSLDFLRASGNAKGVQLVERMGPDPAKWSRKDFEEKNRHIVRSKNHTVPNMIMDLMLPSMLSSPDHKYRDLLDIFKGMSFSLDHLFNELMTYHIRDLGMRFELPFFVFQGDADLFTPTVAAKAYFDEIEAPRKEFVLIKNAGHLACFARPDQFLEELIERVRPLAFSSEKRNRDAFMVQ
ncbi:alpha/beta fold hydrolase [Cohnella sp. REN36]|uniref:alpha/beta fold hydrolase n=1 Tax=Cohnella sp. REN36 TaxID=2887347 RepID=UPI001D14949A|nr:alpha/beta hydrolase [Cohnella sp. REN36]MCC3375770.1 alpha/beta hydrolase [Cohnella sp. REN36]